MDDKEKIIQVLKQNNLTTLKEISQKTYFSNSTIKRYIKKAKESGVNIKSVIGRNGGYILEDKY